MPLAPLHLFGSIVPDLNCHRCRCFHRLTIENRRTRRTVPVVALLAPTDATDGSLVSKCHQSATLENSDIPFSIWENRSATCAKHNLHKECKGSHSSPLAGLCCGDDPLVSHLEVGWREVPIGLGSSDSDTMNS